MPTLEHIQSSPITHNILFVQSDQKISDKDLVLTDDGACLR